MSDESAAGRVPALVRDLCARLRSHRRSRSTTAETTDAASAATRTSADEDRAVPGYFCRTCGADFEGRHGTCPACGGGMIECGLQTH